MADTYKDHPARLGMVPLSRVLRIISEARIPVTNTQSLSEMDRHLDTIINVKATILRHLSEAFAE